MKNNHDKELRHLVSFMPTLSSLTLSSTCPQVCTGVYNPRSPLPSDQSSVVTETVFHGHGDLVLEPDLVEPSHVVEDVEAAVDLLLQVESSVTCDL